MHHSPALRGSAPVIPLMHYKYIYGTDTVYIIPVLMKRKTDPLEQMCSRVPNTVLPSRDFTH